jgi:MFS transporter, OPA family, glycerol-3-phosphate transporter
MPGWLANLLPIVGLLAVIAVVVSRLPKIDLGHSPAFLRRRVQNWLPVGLTYAFLYMGRYNINSAIDKETFSVVYALGTFIYGISFIINGPITDKIGGRKTIIISAAGVLVSNLLMGLLFWSMGQKGKVTSAVDTSFFIAIGILYAMNMYFQSFGAVAIVKVNSAWFHLRERGTFGGIFGILISLGLYFAFDWSAFIFKSYGASWVFIAPALILVPFLIADIIFVRDTPGEAGFRDFDQGDASSGDTGGPLPVSAVAKKMLTNPIILTIAFIEFCSGYLRNSIMQYYRYFAADVGRADDFVANNWGVLNCIAGILGGIFAGIISDRIFQSRRGPVSAVLYGIMVAGAIMMFLTLQYSIIGWVVLMMTLSIIGVHGMLSGTASVDFGGKKNAGVAVGIIDGFVYLGVAAEAVVLGLVLPATKSPEAKDPANWWTWPAAILPLAVIGFVLALRVWNAKPKAAAPVEQKPAVRGADLEPKAAAR